MLAVGSARIGSVSVFFQFSHFVGCACCAYLPLAVGILLCRFDGPAELRRRGCTLWRFSLALSFTSGIGVAIAYVHLDYKIRWEFGI